MQLLNLSVFVIDKGRFKRFSSDFERRRAKPTALRVECGGLQITSRVEMASGRDKEGCPELEDAPALYKSGVWEHFGFHVTYDSGNKTIDRTATVCKHCATCIQYANFTYISYAEVYFWSV